MASTSQKERARAFLALHRDGFVQPNAWDAGSAIVLAAAGFEAIATTSGGIAFSLGKPDYQMGDADLSVSRDEMLVRIREITAAVGVSVNGDLEAGYGDTPEAVAETIRLAAAAGLAGGNIEDRVPGEARLYDEALAVERIRAARAAGDEGAFVVNARCDALLLSSRDGLAAAIRRGNLYREAGADCVFIPGPDDITTVRTLVREISGPLNIVNGLGNARFRMGDLLEAGVKRISVGASIARAAFAFIRAAAKELHDEGTMRYADGQIPQGELNAQFVSARRLTA
jgi:2-methylisocitrate lyase-like PEP mutase family enzyme